MQQSHQHHSKYKISHSSSSAHLIAGAKISPADFTKIKMIGKGDVGRVYLVRGNGASGENNVDKLFAMKGISDHFIDFQVYCSFLIVTLAIPFVSSVEQEGNAKEKEN